MTATIDSTSCSDIMTSFEIRSRRIRHHFGACRNHCRSLIDFYVLKEFTTKNKKKRTIPISMEEDGIIKLGLGFRVGTYMLQLKLQLPNAILVWT